MEFKLRGTNVIGIELLTNRDNFSVEGIKQFVSEKRQLLKGARFLILVEDYPLKREEVEELVNFFSKEEGITFCGFKTNLKENRELCVSLGVPCDISTLELEKSKERSPTEEVKLVKKTLRSGDKITSTGDLVIMGDVNPGAEVEAGGDVFVLGSLRGFVRAGIGKSEGEVRALYFEAPRLELCGKEMEFERKERFINFRAKVKSGKIKLEHLKRGI
ncbi:septum site-determining protein MinC [Thermovibrio sp.]